MSARYLRSRQFYERACKVIPGGVSSNNRANWTPFPLFYMRGEGSHVWDVDGNKYIDYVLGRGALILGHSPVEVVEAVNKQYSRGQLFAGQTTLEFTLAEKIRELVPSAEMTRFCNSGSEAVHAALRLARSATGRSKIVRFEGHYHGWYDNIAWGFTMQDSREQSKVLPCAMSLGQPVSDIENIIILPWNDLKALEVVFKECSFEIAAVIMEPIMFNSFWSNVSPLDNYLLDVQKLCSEHDVLLIFDEIQTGFRTAAGGAQSQFGVSPDISTFAKAMAGGACLAAVSGKQKYMELFVLSNTIHTGTYNASPSALAGATESLSTLSENGNEKVSFLHSLSVALAKGLEEIASDSKLPMQVRYSPGAVTTTFRSCDRTVIDYRSARQGLNMDLLKMWHSQLQEYGVRITPEGLWYVSAAHSMMDIDVTIELASKAAKKLMSF